MFFSLNKVEDHPLSRFQPLIRQFFEQCVNARTLDWSLFPVWFQSILERFDATKDRFQQVFDIVSNYGDEEKKRSLLEAFDRNNDIERLCNDKSLTPGIINDSPENLQAIKKLFEKLFNETFRDKNLFEDVEDSSLDDHYRSFRKLNKVCPFCGIEKYSDVGVKPRENYDHYLHESEYFIAGINFDNIVPMCYKCNSRGNKGSKDVLFEYDGNTKSKRRRLAYYPYAPAHGVNIEVTYARDLTSTDIEKFTTALVPVDENEAEKVNTWNDVFDVTNRLNARIKEEQKAWIEELIEGNFSENICNENEFRQISSTRAAKLVAKIQSKPEAVLEGAFMTFLANTEHSYLLSGYCGIATSSLADELERRKENLYR